MSSNSPQSFTISRRRLHSSKNPVRTDQTVIEKTHIIPYIDDDNFAQVNTDLKNLHSLFGKYKLVGSAAVMIYCMAYGTRDIKRDCQSYSIGDYDIVFTNPDTIAKKLIHKVMNNSAHVHGFTLPDKSEENNNKDKAKRDKQYLDTATTKLSRHINNIYGIKVKLVLSNDQPNRIVELDLIRENTLANKRKTSRIQPTVNITYYYNIGDDRKIELDNFKHLYTQYIKSFNNNNASGNDEKVSKKAAKHTKKTRIVKMLKPSINNITKKYHGNNMTRKNNANNSRDEPSAKRGTPTKLNF